MVEEEPAAEALQPIVNYLKVGPDGGPYLVGSKCRSCGHTFVGDRNVCAKCFARDRMESVRLAEEGTLYTWTIVHRSFAGVETPFIDVIVDQVDGCHLKGTLRQVEPDPEKIAFDMPVRVEYGEIVPTGSDKPYLTYYFVPA